MNLNDEAHDLILKLNLPSKENLINLLKNKLNSIEDFDKTYHFDFPDFKVLTTKRNSITDDYYEIIFNNKVAKTKSNFDENTQNYSLSTREKEIVNLITRGLTNKEIAEELYVSINTIKTHIKTFIQN